VVFIAAPPPRVRPDPLWSTVPAGSRLLRLFDPVQYGATPTGFRYHGPHKRFDHHEGQGSERRASLSTGRGVYYGGFTLSGCLVEVFGDTRVIEWGEWHVAGPRVRRDLRLLDLRRAGAMRAGSVAALAKVAHRSLSQAWARYFYEHPGVYGEIDGLLYLNAHNDDEAVALCERCADMLTCGLDDVARLDDPDLRPLILDVARQHSLVIE
jgi:hypothetical protein